MPRIFTNPFPRFYGTDGVSANSNGKLYFYEPAAGETLKAVYSNKALTNALTNPVILDDQGRLQTEVWLNGDYKIKITNSAGVTIAEVNNYEPADVDAQFSDWDATKTYAVNDFSRGSNGKYYQSLSSGNVGNNPVTSPQYWVEKFFQDVWNQYKTYPADEIVSYSGDIWVSLQSSNIGNTPSTSSAYWRSFFVPATETGYSATSFEYRGDSAGIFGLGALGVETNITRATWESVGPTGSGADYEWSALDDLPADAKALIFNCVGIGSGTSTYVDLELAMRENGTTASELTLAKVLFPQSYATSGTNAVSAVAQVTVLVDENLMFEVYWDDTGTGGRNISAYLLGFKV